jgi:hypothetical protein
MSPMTDKNRKKLFFKIYSESDSRHLVPGSPRADELLDTLRRDEIRKIYIICSNSSISQPYINLFRRLGHSVHIRDIIIDRIERQHIYTIKSIIDDVNATIKKEQNCEIIFFNGNIAGVVLACFHVNANRNTSSAVEQVRRIAPKTMFSGSDLAFIDHFNDNVRVAQPGEEEPRHEAVVPEAAPRPVPEAPAKLAAAPTEPVPAAAGARSVAERPAGPLLENILVRFRIGPKLVAMVSLIVALSVSLMIVLGTLAYKKDSEEKQNASNRATAQMFGDRLEDELVAALEKARVAAEFTSSGASSERLAARAGELLFRDRSNFIFMGIARRDHDGLTFGRTFYNSAYLNESQLQKKDLREIHAKNAVPFMDSFHGRVIIRNISPDMGIPVMGISFPYERKKGEVGSIIVCYVPLDRFITACGATGRTRTFMVSDQGDCVVAAERNRVLSRINMADMPIVQKMLVSTVSRGEMRYRDHDGTYYLGSFRKLDLFGLGIVVASAEDNVFRELYGIERRNFVMLAIVLIIGMLCSFAYSRTISAPIESLRQLTESSPIGGLKLSAPPEGDEVHFLTNSFREVYNAFLESGSRAPEAAPVAPPVEETATPETFAGPKTEGEPARPRMSQQFMAEGMQVQVTYAGPDVTMSWVGRGNLANPGELLNPYLEGVINSLRGRVLTCDFSTLETMNAAMMQSIIRFAEILDENRIQATFMYNKSLDWQDAAFEALGAVVQYMTTISLDGRQIEKNLFVLT